ncbi:hypothetical protein [Tenacibaculum ovolyticum]|uniref:hypothetical protein n=1 Tax=Tenacibaculum ovolyticum TaxID=104270 RepID=UPI0007ED3DA2|nr:hypothetical protein [Tenacibaculum ovolyticum]
MSHTEVPVGKEDKYFSLNTIQKFIMDFNNDIDKQEKTKFYKGACAYDAVDNLKGEKVDVWVEWNARRIQDALDIGITKLIYYDLGTIPDVVLDRWNIVSKELKRDI